MATVQNSIPRDDVDIFSNEVIAEPWEHYRKLRDLGSVVWLDASKIYALPRYAEVRAALADDQRFASSKGIAFNDQMNEVTEGTMLASDGDEHQHLRTIVGRPLAPRALRRMRAGVEEIGRKLVDRALEEGTFDAIEMLAKPLPLNVVPDLLGWDDEVRPRLMNWGEASFDAIGPDNELSAAAWPKIIEMVEYAKLVAGERRCAAGSLSAKVLEAADRGEVSHDQCPALMLDYLAPSLDTTASGLGAAFYLFSTHPEQWQLLREDPRVIPNAINEVLRWQSPLRAFTRYTTEDVEIDGMTIPVDSRVAIMYASANRDERFWDQPEEFDITRENASRHVAFGYGPHGCAGQGLTRLETEVVLEELARHVVRFEPAGAPVLGTNNVIYSYSSVPVTVVLA